MSAFALIVSATVVLVVTVNQVHAGVLQEDFGQGDNSTDRASCSCGRANYERIVGGHQSRPHRYPWMVHFVDKYKDHICGGSVISRRYVLTAAHCVHWGEERMVVYAGDHNRNADDDKSQKVGVAEVILHPKFDNYVKDYDFALLKLERDLQFHREVGPICLPTGSQNDFAGEWATVAGWGKTVSTTSWRETTAVLRETRVRVMRNSDCGPRFPSHFNIAAYKLCAAADGRDACDGDSGGPLAFKKRDGRYLNIGVVSYGIKCAHPKWPGIYARTSHEVQWIKDNTRDSPPCFVSPY